MKKRNNNIVMDGGCNEEKVIQGLFEGDEYHVSYFLLL